MSRHAHRVTSGQRNKPVKPIETSLSSAYLSVLVALLTCMFLWPSEAAMQGDGLHLSFLWLAAASVTCFWNLHAAPVCATEDLRWTGKLPWQSARWLVNIGLLVLLAGIWLSTYHVFWISGDRRAALNLAFEWTAIGACAFLCRRIFVSPAHRHLVVTLVAGLGVGLAVFGMWKSQVVYAEEARSYREKRQILDSASGSMNAVRIRQEFLTNDIPMEGPARQLYENRLLNSTEPFATFALANTFAGILAVSLVLLLSRVYAGWQSTGQTLWSLILPLLLAAVVGWCLILTKSRTAWVGAGSGVLLISLCRTGKGDNRSVVPRSVKRSFVIVSLILALLFVCMLTGAIDRQVFLEAPRSFQFRLFYWIGAAGVIAESWFFGAGPGNFRQLYLRHKVVESSESILDPHNIVLDAWCFAGIIGLAGLLFFVVGIVRSYIRCESASAQPNSQTASVIPGLIGCLIVHFGWRWMSGATLTSEDGMLALAIGIAAGSMIVINRLPWAPHAPAAAAVTLLVHLLGAGGLHISITGILLVVLACAASPPHLAGTLSNRRPHTPVIVAGGLVATGMAAAVLFFGVIPVRSSGIYQALGQQRMYLNDVSGALDAFNQAAQADPLNPMVRQQIVTATAYDLLNPDAGIRSNQEAISDQQVEAIEAACNQWIQADRRQLKSRLTRGHIRHGLFQITGDEWYAKSCVADLRQAVSWHPTSASLQMELAACEDELGSPGKAVSAAEQALAIEAVNREWQHSDQYLTETDLQLAYRIIDGTEE